MSAGNETAKREAFRRCAPIFDRIQRRLDDEDRAARVNRPHPKS